MKVRIQVIIESAAGEPPDICEIACIQHGELRPDTVGLTLEEAKTVLERVQQQVVEQQATEYLHTQSHCPHCGAQRYHKDAHTITIRT